MKNYIAVPLIVLTMMLGATFNLPAAEMRGYTFPENYYVQDHHLELQGLALKNKLFWDIFVAGFYLEKDVGVNNALDSVAKRIEVIYLRDLQTEVLIEETKEDLRETLSPSQYEMIMNKIDEMGAYFQNIEAGDRFAFTCLPGEDTVTVIERNGEMIEEVKGEKFARALFSVWIGQRPANTYIKRQLLGLR